MLQPLGATTAPLAGDDLDLPGAGITLRGTQWTNGGQPGATRPDAAPAVVLLHGLSSQRRFFNLVVTGLAGLDVLALDLRGHGDSERPDGPYDVVTCAADVLAAVEAWRPQGELVLVGHSWGASVAVAAAAMGGDRVAAAVAIDGGAFPNVEAQRRGQLREVLTPPRLALPPNEVAQLYASGPLAPWWTGAHADAVLPGWAVDADGLARSRLGFDRHMAVLDGLLEHDGEQALAEVLAPLWLVTCEPPSASADVEEWVQRREAVLQRALAERSNRRLLRWTGALHDVPLQWPELVAGLIRTVAAEAQAGVR